ncbi:hypothetical protein TCAL_03550 [Tigriopus californicus]|uniref:Uncharacterized protein n=1 Tax=Tigriopus californicus TaxID=6832 RepID=A0A553NFL5_TIGCA|nr:uncharacterized protein C8orf76-like [Tigriopus californicus]TRY64236.1 hypothetical protein TCAL_03550 [Tigriopus californicus]|eukprot:TCALIF_03550-PA protein Name:"Similar to C8orf76 Uncharacterized protein C8orf76 (Homo sapiens)" AED:0.00 eAED:0.00 QI:131/1/1/1/1/1/3/901/324
MELGLNLEDDDFQGQSKKDSDNTISNSASLSYLAKQCPHKWFDNAQGPIGEADVQTLKFNADQAYLEKDYVKAFRFYEEVLKRTSKKNMSNRRDMMESLARCALHQNRSSQALEWALELHNTSHPNNIDHLTVSHDLLSQVYDAQGDSEESLAHLSRIIHIHPFVPDFWTRIGQCYVNFKDKILEYPISKSNLKQVQAFCFIRALVLLQRVETTVRSFAKEPNVKGQKVLLEQIRSFSLHPEEADRLHFFASLDIAHSRSDAKSGDAQSSASDSDGKDFQDLGRSERIKALEKEFENVPDSRAEWNPSMVIEGFELEWFKFMVE